MHRPRSSSPPVDRKKPKKDGDLDLAVNEEEFLLPLTCKDILESTRSKEGDKDSWSVWNGTRPLGIKGMVYIVVKSPIRLDQRQASQISSGSKKSEDFQFREYILTDESGSDLRVLLPQHTGPISNLGNPPVISSKSQFTSNNKERSSFYSIRDNIHYHNRLYHIPMLDKAAEDALIDKPAFFFSLVGRPALFDRTGYVKLAVYQVRESTEEEYLFHQLYSLSVQHGVSFSV